MDILSFFACFETFGLTIQIRQLSIICQAMLAMTGRITMLSISRWADKGGSYRTIQRFFATRLPWSQMLTKFFEIHLFNPNHEYLLAGDETIVSKAGQKSFGIDRFFSGLAGKVIRGLSFFVFSLVDTVERQAYPVMVKQTIRSEAEKAAIKARKKKRVRKSKKTRKKGCGRRPGSRNRDKGQLNFSPELERINEMLSGLVKLLRKFVALNYLVLNGHFGHNQAVLMARRNDLHLISKLRRDAVLYEKDAGLYGGRGPKKKYGERLNYEQLPLKYLRHSERQGDEIKLIYQGIFRHKEFAAEINVVIVVKINVRKQKVGQVVLFSSDLELGLEKLVDYYCLRFQIEFNFRDAKQHFGLEDFMTTRETGVENAACMSFLMVLLSGKLIKNSKEKVIGINDLKTRYRGAKYAVLILKKVLKKPEPILMKRIIEEVGRLGSIYRTKSASSSA
jgi:putative transposase